MITYRLAALLALPIASALGAQASFVPLDSAPFSRKAIGSREVTWKRVDAPHSELFVKAGSSAERVMAKLSSSVGEAIAHDLRMLGAPRVDRKLRIFFVGGRKEMTPFTGGTEGGGAIAPEAAAIMIANDTVAPPLRHELMHVLSWRLWGTPSSTWISEGLAMLATGPCVSYEVDDIAAILLAEHRLPSLDTLRNAFDVRKEVGAMHYVASASLVSFMLKRFGRDRFHSVWSTPRGLARAQEILGVDAGALEHDWRQSLATRPAPRTTWKAVYREIAAHGCE